MKAIVKPTNLYQPDVSLDSKVFKDNELESYIVHSSAPQAFSQFRWSLSTLCYSLSKDMLYFSHQNQLHQLEENLIFT